MHRLLALWVNLRSSLWFLPSLIVMSAIALALGLVEIGRMFPLLAQDKLPAAFGFSAQGSRAMLSAIASSMITVAGVVFSITIVALSLASQQYSPRVLRHFMRDRGNQSVLGVFVGIFAYCLVVLPGIRGGEENGHVPAIAVAVGVALALVGVVYLIYFIHHVATSIQASSIVTTIAAETHHAISELFPHTLGEEAESEPRELRSVTWHPIAASTSGELQIVNESALLKAAVAHDLLLKLDYCVGDFVLSGTPIASTNRPLDPKGDEATAIAASFTIDHTRTIEQDPAFGIRQIVDVALRALSPAMNDTTTAILCLNVLTDLLRHAATRQAESPFRVHDGKLRVVAKRATFETFVQLSFNQIRENGGRNVALLQRILWALEAIAAVTRAPNRRHALARSADALADAAVCELRDSEWRREMVARARQLSLACGRNA